MINFGPTWPNLNSNWKTVDLSGIDDMNDLFEKLDNVSVYKRNIFDPELKRDGVIKIQGTKCNISSSDEGLVIKLYVPGIKKENLDVYQEDNILYVRTNNEMDNQDKPTLHLRQDVFNESVDFRYNMGLDEIKDVKLEDGILKITSVKVDPEKEKLHFKIQ